MKTKNNYFVTTVLSVLLPGASQLLKGQGHKTLLGYSLFFLLPILFFTFKLQYHFRGLIALLFCFAVLYVLNVVDASFGKEESMQFMPLGFLKWLIILLAVDAYAVKKYLNHDYAMFGIKAVRVLTGSMAPPYNLVIFRC